MITSPADGESLSPQDIQTLLGTYAAVSAAKNPLAATGNTSQQSMDTTNGITTTQTNKNFANPNILNQLRNMFGGRPGSNLGAPQQQGAPAPSGGNNAPSIPPTGGGNQMGNMIDQLGGQTPTKGPVGKAIGNKLIEEANKRQESIHKIGNFEMQANDAADNLTRAILNGSSKNFMGWLQGNPFMSDIRTMTGEVKPEEALQKLLSTDMLYGKLGANIRGRFTVPEITGHMRNMGGLTQTPQNALMAITALKLQANLQRMYEHGDISAKDAPVLNNLVRNEMDRVQQAVQNASPQDKAGVIGGGQVPPTMRLNDLQDLFAKAKQAGVVGKTGTGAPTLDEINAEVARRKAAKK